jgi:hypothetical protein
MCIAVDDVFTATTMTMTTTVLLTIVKLIENVAALNTTNVHRCRRIAASAWLLLLPRHHRGIALLLLLLRLPCVMSTESSSLPPLLPFHA